MPRILLEVTVDGADAASAAQAAGADRLELCSALDLAGLTPSIGLIREVCRAVSIPVVVLVRPRPGHFAYTPAEFAVIRRDVDTALDAGAAAVAVGCLTPERQIDVEKCAALARQAGPDRAVFHRAFDLLPDLTAGLERLIDLGYTRVLTSGGRPTAPDGAGTLAHLVRQAGPRIEVLAAGGVRPENAESLLRSTGLRQIHGSFSTLADDDLGPLGVGQRRIVDIRAVRAVRATLDHLSVS